MAICSLLILTHCGCAGFSKRYHRDDVVLARQIARQGADAFHEGEWALAEEYYSKAVEICPVDERVRARYAETMWNRGLHKDAIKHQLEAVRLSGGDPDLMIRLGEMYLVQGELNEANQLAQRVIDSGRESAAAFRLRGGVSERQGNWREALAAYHRALSIQPSYAEVQFAVAQVYQRNGHSQRSLSTLQALAATYPPGEEPADLMYWSGMASASLGRHQKAVEYFASAESHGLRSADLEFQLAESYHRIGDVAAARVALDRAMQMDPTHPQAARVCEAIRGDNRVARARN